MNRFVSHLKGSGHKQLIHQLSTCYVPFGEKHNIVWNSEKKNKREILVAFLPIKEKTINSSMFGFQKKVSLVSFNPHKNKSVILLSTMHKNISINAEAEKPGIIHFYNSTKGGVDTVDQLCGNYSVSKRTRRWPLCIFSAAKHCRSQRTCFVQHSMVKRCSSEPTAISYKFGDDLYETAGGSSINHKNLPVDIQRFLAKYKPQQAVVIEESSPKVRKRCQLCGRTKNRVTTKKWSSSNDFVCKEHSTTNVQCITYASPVTGEYSIANDE